MPITPKVKPTSHHVKEMTMAALNTKRKAIRYAMAMAGEAAVSYARDTLDTYKDRTGNLRSSVGFSVAENGNVVSSSDFSQMPPKEQTVAELNGGEVGKAKALEIIKESPNHDFILVLVAGMNYAEFVQRLYSLDVLQGASMIMENELMSNLKAIK